MNEKEHLNKDLLQRYGERRLSASELIRVVTHLEDCDDCYQEFCAMFPNLHQAPKEFTNALLSKTEDEQEFHLNYEEHLRPFVDDEINDIDREIVESHLMVCNDCARLIRELREFKESLELRMMKEEAQNAQPSLWAKIANGFSKIFHSSSMRVAFASLVLVAVIVVVWWLLRDRNSQTVQEATNKVLKDLPIVVLTPSPETIVSASPTPSPSVPKEKKQNSNAINDGSLILALNTQGQLTGAESLSQTERQVLERTLRSERIEVASDLGTLSRTVTRSSSSGFALQNPVGQILKTDRPLFRWQALSGATDYTVRVLDENLESIATSPTLNKTSWQMDKPLARGKIYAWEVVAKQNDKSILSPADNEPAVKFKIISSKDFQDIQSAERGNSHLLRGIAYARAGLLDEAERELIALQNSNSDSALIKKLLIQIQEAKRRFNLR
jgi:hypothetical protein